MTSLKGSILIYRRFWFVTNGPFEHVTLGSTSLKTVIKKHNTNKVNVDILLTVPALENVVRTVFLNVLVIRYRNNQIALKSEHS